MRRFLGLLPALVAVLLLTGVATTKTGLFPLYAEAQDPVGAWALAVHTPDQQDDFSLTTFHADGTMTVSDTPMSLQTGPNSVLTRTYTSAGHGVWAKQAGSLPGDRKYALTFIEMTNDDAGSTPSLVTIRATISLSESGDTFTGPFAYSVATIDGRVLQSGRGTVDGKRIGVQPLQ
jgi:hypothetical protein